MHETTRVSSEILPPPVLTAREANALTRTASNVSAPTQFVDVGNQRYAYRRFGEGRGLPLLFLQHFT